MHTSSKWIARVLCTVIFAPSCLISPDAPPLCALEASSCGACIQLPGCGYCDATDTCLPGTSLGDRANACTSGWQFAECNISSFSGVSGSTMTEDEVPDQPRSEEEKRNTNPDECYNARSCRACRSLSCTYCSDDFCREYPLDVEECYIIEEQWNSKYYCAPF